MKNKVLHIGVTGGIGSGKSIICKIFNVLGIPVYNSDNRAKWLMQNDIELVSQIKNLFGEKAYFVDGQLNNSFLAKNVFHNKEKLNSLNSLVHPSVQKDFSNWVDKHESFKYIIKEAALLFETGIYKNLDHIILVTAPQEIKIQRVLLRDSHRSREQVLAIIDKQMSDELKIPLANSQIINDNNQMILPQVLKLHNEFIK